MRLTLKDKSGQLYALNSHEHRVRARGGRGQKVFSPKGALAVIGRLHLHLLPGQTMAVTCPGCQVARVFEDAGSHYVNYHCAKCVAV